MISVEESPPRCGSFFALLPHIKFHWLAINARESLTALQPVNTVCNEIQFLQRFNLKGRYGTYKPPYKVRSLESQYDATWFLFEIVHVNWFCENFYFKKSRYGQESLWEGVYLGMARVRKIPMSETKWQYHFQCPGCDEEHAFNDEVWVWNQNYDQPTLSPSFLIHGARFIEDSDKTELFRCHSFIKDGKIQFLGDCTHKLKNQTVDLIEYDMQSKCLGVFTLKDTVKPNYCYYSVRAWELKHPMNKGEFYVVKLLDGIKLYVSCPGCGVPSFTGTHKISGSGTVWSAHPSLVYTCCGWHGFLKNGVFRLA